MAQQQKVNVDPQQLEEAKAGWVRFTNLLKWSVIASVGILALLGLIFIDW